MEQTTAFGIFLNFQAFDRVIIGIENYENTPLNAPYADSDAKVFRDYAVEKLGVTHLVIWCTTPDRFTFPVDTNPADAESLNGDLTANKIKIVGILISFFFLTGFIAFFSILGPSVTAITSGNIYKAGAQYYINKSIKDTTGKNSLDLVKEKIEKKDNTNYLNQELKQLVERRIKLARKKLNLNNINQ